MNPLGGSDQKPQTCQGKPPAAPVAPPTCGGSPAAGGSDRREFLRLFGGASVSLVGAGLAGAASLPARAADGDAPGELAADHRVPIEKNLDPAWLAGLTSRGEPAWYEGDELETIAMPIGGICAGQLYLAGDGRLAHWDVMNQRVFSGYGATCYDLGRKPSLPLAQGFAVEIRSAAGTVRRTLDRRGFPGVRFRGEYPIGWVDYADASLPVAIRLEAFSPFIPLDAPDSALPATILRFTLENRSNEPIDVRLGGWLENGVCHQSGLEMSGRRINRVTAEKTWTAVVSSAVAAPPERPPRPAEVLADFEGDDYGSWRVEGEALGTRPARGTLPNQQEVAGFQGRGLVNTYLGGDQLRGKLVSPTFTIERPYISFLIGGGGHAAKTCINLVVDGKVVRTATGANNERLDWRNWRVADLRGKQAHLEIVDDSTGGWGHINIDQIELGDVPRSPRTGKLEEQNDFGTMAFALLSAGAEVEACAGLQAEPTGDKPDGAAALFADDAGLQPVRGDAVAEAPLDAPLLGALGRRARLEPGGRAEVVFLVAWHFPNRPERGNYYATRFHDALGVARHVVEHFDRLAAHTRLWHDTWYDSTLPRWLLDRLFSTVSILATSTCQWWANGRFWAWEGVGCCHGTCAHVWNYEHAMARLFPELERSVRVMQDLAPEAGFDEATGMVWFRGEGWQMWAGDSQAGTVLKVYREHLVSADDAFLRACWPRARKCLEFLFEQDRDGGAADGILEGKQHNTYDIDFYGANTMVGSLYLAALRAGEEMARHVGDEAFAAECRRLFESGRRFAAERLFNGEYFIQTVDLSKHPQYQYALGCLADQLFGQSWAHQVGLGHLYPAEQVVSALRAIWKYNWAPDVGPQNDAHPPERWFARPGEAGLFLCTWPRGGRPKEPVRYRDEVWTGIEYQVAAHMAAEGMVTEALAICRAIHDRYHPAKRNPWNEVECGDHYARAMAAHGVLLALCGFEYDGPRGHLAFAPRLGADDFRAPFTAAEGWGTIAQQRDGAGQTSRVELKHGRLRLTSLGVELPDGTTARTVELCLNGQPLAADHDAQGRRLVARLSKELVLAENDVLSIRVAW